MLLILFVIALLPRVAGVLWGGVHPDENINASVKLLAGQWIPDAHYYPPLSNILNAAAFGVMFVIGRLVGVWHSLGDFRAQYFTDPTPFQMAGRLVCATIGALAAPLTALLASRFGARRLGIFGAGLLIALLPVNVLLSHISKSTDVGMATAFILAALCFVDFTRDPANWKRAVALGAAIALAVSFKHSAVFFVAPLLLAAIVLAAPTFRDKNGALIRALLLIAATAGLLWIVLNIPILADLKNFIKFQKVQSQMSSRPGPVVDILRVTVPYIAATYTGATVLILAAFAVLPLLRRDKPMLLLWACTIIGILVVMKLTGLRPTVGLYLPYTTLMTALVGVAFASWGSSSRRPARMVGCVGLVVCGVLLGVGCFRVVKQAMAEPAIDEVARVIRTTMPPDVKIMATRPEHAGLPISVEATAGERARHERLAAKYHVTLPGKAQERDAAGTTGGYHVRRIPWVTGGLEVYDEKDVKTIAPFGWPIQKEEYDLDYWTSQGFTVFVLTDEQERLTSGVKPYVKLYEQIRASCDLVKEVKARKPLLWEGDTRIYRLRSSPSTRP